MTECMHETEWIDGVDEQYDCDDCTVWKQRKQFKIWQREFCRAVLLVEAWQDVSDSGPDSKRV